MYNYFIKIQYDGSAHKGWQRLSNNPNTVQGHIEHALTSFTGEAIEITGSGRTDAGVHALAQTANFHFANNIFIKNNTAISEFEILKQLNALLPESINIFYIQPIYENFHSRKSCIKKTYVYAIVLDTKPDVFTRKYTYCPADMPIFLKEAPILDYNAMRAGAKLLLGEHDFSSFTSDKSDKSHVRTLYDISFSEIEKNNKHILLMEFTGNGFLYNMVRILSGTLLEIGLGQIIPEQIPEILNTKQRLAAGKTLPPNGLFLKEVTYK